MFLRQHLTSLHEFDIFLTDIHCFLEDMKHSCVKSYQQHLECTQKLSQKIEHGGTIDHATHHRTT